MARPRFNVHLAVARCREGSAAERASVGSDVQMRAQVSLEIAQQLLRFAADVALIEDIVPPARPGMSILNGIVFGKVFRHLLLTGVVKNLPRDFFLVVQVIRLLR